MENKADRSILILLPENKVEGMQEFRHKHIQSEGKEVPFHITLLPDFYLPRELNKNIISKINQIASTFPKFAFRAVPISSFPTSNVIYLSPVPTGPIEQLVFKLKSILLKYEDDNIDDYIHHMTIAMGNPHNRTKDIVQDYFSEFGKKSLNLKAGKLAIYVKKKGKWHKYRTFELA